MKMSLGILIQTIEKQPRVDLAYIAELSELDEGEKPQDQLLGSLIDIFAIESEKQFATICLLLAANDTQTISKVAHRMRSTCHNVGARRLAKIMELIELESETPVPDYQTLRELLLLAEDESLEASADLMTFKRVKAA